MTGKEDDDDDDEGDDFSPDPDVDEKGRSRGSAGRCSGAWSAGSTAELARNIPELPTREVEDESDLS
jgi:hypothetical protein